MSLTNKQKAFVLEYLKDFNATRAAERAGYGGDANVLAAQGSRLLKNVKVAKKISEHLAEKAMSADEVLSRLAEIARADIGDFVPEDANHPSLDYAKEQGISYLVKSVTDTKYGQKFELHDSLAALVHIGRHHKLFTDKVEVEVEAVYDKLAELIESGSLPPEELIKEYGIDYAQELFKRVGIVVVASGQDTVGASVSDDAE